MLNHLKWNPSKINGHVIDASLSITYLDSESPFLGFVASSIIMVCLNISVTASETNSNLFVWINRFKNIDETEHFFRQSFSWFTESGKSADVEAKNELLGVVRRWIQVQECLIVPELCWTGWETVILSDERLIFFSFWSRKCPMAFLNPCVIDFFIKIFPFLKILKNHKY